MASQGFDTDGLDMAQTLAGSNTRRVEVSSYVVAYRTHIDPKFRVFLAQVCNYCMDTCTVWDDPASI